MDEEDLDYRAQDDEEDYWWDADDNFDDEDDEEYHTTDKDTLVEGGDFHLKSALRDEQDMEYNPIYKKEKESVVTEIGDIGDIIEHINVISFIEKIGERIASDTYGGTIAKYLKDGGFSIIDIEEHVKLIKAELMCVVRNIGLMDLDIKISGAYQRFFQENLIVKCTLNTILFLLALLNNVKNLRQDMEVHHDIKNILYKRGKVICIPLAVATICYLTTDLIVFDIDGTRSYIPKTYFINGCDKIQERFNVILYSYIAEALQIPGSCPTTIVQRVIAWGDYVLHSMGNDGFNVLGLYEAVLVGMILERDDQDLIPHTKEDSFLNNLLNELDGQGTRYLRWLITLLQDMEPSQLADLHGLYRIWGHPIIDIDGGVRKLQRVTQEKKDGIDKKIESTNTIRSFRRLFVLEYFKKHSIYPPMKFTATFNMYLSRCINSNQEIDEKHINYKFSDWDFVTLEQAFSIPYSWNVLHLAKDKAISPTRSEMFQMLLKTGRVFNAELRRGVLKLMTTTLIPLRDFLTRVATDGLDIDDCIIGLFPKERELKIMARFFSLLSFKMRLYFTATEELLGDKLLKYFPQITMSSNLLEMQEKMASLSKNLQQQRKSVTYVINMDFVKWNQQMREQTCVGVFTELDRVFGLPGLYTRSHQIFRDSVLYVADGSRSLLPDPDTGIMIDGNVCWTDDGAGKEGIRQKAWTIMTVCDIAAVARLHPGQFHLVGGGDNQVLTVTYHTNQVDIQGNITQEGKKKIKEKVLRFLSNLEEHFAERGLPLKTSETWCSTSLFMYNKFMYYKGAPLRSPLKQVSRLFPYSNNTSMTLQSMSQCLGTGLRSVAQKELSHIPCLIMRNLWGCILSWIVTFCHPMAMKISCFENIRGDGIIHRSRRPLKMRVTQIDLADLAIKIIYLPSQLGGPGLVNVLQLCMRGFPDPVTEGIYFLKALREFSLVVGSRYASILQRMSGVSFAKGRNYEPLVEDVCSLNTDTPRSGTSEQREVARKILLKSKLGGNDNLQGLLNIMRGDFEKEFYKALTSGRTLDVRVLHEIASSSLYAITNTFTSRVDKTATLRRLTLRYSMVEQLASAERTYIRYLIVRDGKQHDIMFNGCSRILADECRSKGWGKTIIGVTVPTPFEYLEIFVTDNHVCDGNHLTTRISSQDKWLTASSLGPCKPYLGTYTKEKFKMTEVAAAYGDEDVLSKAIRILKIINWRYMDGTLMSEILKAPFQSVTDIDPQRMVQENSVTKGDYDHRRKMDSRVHGGIPNFVITPLSHMSICTSTWTTHARGGKNENIHFQACIIQTMYKLLCLTMNNSRYNDTIHSHEVCASCICEIQEPNVEDVTPRMDINFPKLVGNPLVYVPEQAITFDYSRGRELEYAARVGSLDCDRETDYTWLDTYSSLSWLIMADVIGWTKMPHSFYLMVQDKVDHYLLSFYIISLWKILKAEFELINTRLDWEPLLKVYSTRRGVEVLSQELGAVVMGSFEGGLELNMKDFCDALNGLKITQIPPFSINLALPKVHKQAVAWWNLMVEDTLTCVECMNILKGYWEGTCINTRIDFDIRCSRHGDGNISPRIINAHISNLSGGLIKLTPDRELHRPTLQAGGDNLHGLEQVPSTIDEWPDEDDITILNQVGEGIDMDGRIKFLIESMAVILPDIIIVTPSLLSMEMVKNACELLQVAKENKIIIHILVEEPSYLESGNIFEMERALPHNESTTVQFSYRETPEGLHKLWFMPEEETVERLLPGDWVILPFSQLVRRHEDVKPDTVMTLRERRLGRLFLVQSGVGLFQPGSLGKYLFSSELDISRKDVKNLDHEINKIMIQNPAIGGRFTVLKRRCSWALFNTKYELLVSVEHIKPKMSVEGRSEKTKEWSRTHKEDVIILMISILMRSTGRDEEKIFTLSYVDYSTETLQIKPRFNKAGVISVRYLDYFWFFKRMYQYEEFNMKLPYREVVKSVNIGSPKQSGYNLASA